MPLMTHSGRRSRSRDCEQTPRKPSPQQGLSPEEEAQILIWQAKGKRAHIYPTTGETLDHFHSIVKIDQEYQLVGNHIDQNTRDRIIKGEYVDFGKLLPKDRILAEDERLELVMKQGQAYWSPVSDSVTINSYNRWEQASGFILIFTRDTTPRGHQN